MKSELEMGTFILTYSIVWSVLALYVTRLGIVQRRLERIAAGGRPNQGVAE